MPGGVRIFDALIITAIGTAVLAAACLSLPPDSAWPGWLTNALQLFSILVFAGEFAWRYALRQGRNEPVGPFALFEFLIFAVPAFGMATAIDPRFVEIALLLSLVKLARFIPALGMVITVMRNEARSLFGGFLALAVLLMLASGFMYAAEHDAQPTVFSSIPSTMWWAIVTMASVGYGDMVPQTVVGRVLAGFIMLMGIAMFAVPAGILATGFAGEIKRRDFIVSWDAIKRVPLFADLEASRIAAIARLLEPQIVPANQVIVRRGDVADAMFVIVKGTVSVEVEPSPVRLGPGQFFGEIGLIMDTTRSATVIAQEECQLLSLDIADFKRLTEQLPDLKARIEKVAAERLAQQKV
ncbi:MAG: cyclic nucleotide-binding domain-containing protein [Hyphomicrobiales bacterium]